MDLLSDMALFDRIVSTGSLSAAGRSLGLSAGAVSQRLKGLEARYGASLLLRSTRAVTLTDEGRIFLETARSVIAETDFLENAIASKTSALAGRLRVAAPSDLARRHVESIAMEFACAHPGVCVELRIGDSVENLVARGVDVAFRYGNLKDSGLIARPLVPNRRVVVASPDYLAAHGAPPTPNELVHHNCLVLVRDDERVDRWTFVVEGEAISYAVDGKLAVNDGEVLRRWALAGKGLAYKSLVDVADDIASGLLLEVLTEFTARNVGAQIVFPEARKTTPRVRHFIDFAVAHFRRNYPKREA